MDVPARVPLGNRSGPPQRSAHPPAATALVAVAVILGTVLAVSVLPARPAGATTSDEARLLALTNQARASVGAPPLSIDPTLSAVARAWAQAMAGRGSISHNPDIGGQVSGWSRLAENVGFGPDLGWVHRALMASPTHYGNLSDPGYSLMGIGVVSSGGQVFVVENFEQPAGAGAERNVGRATAVVEPEPPRPAARQTTTTMAAPEPPAKASQPPEPPPSPSTSSYPFVLDALRALDHHNGRR